MYWKLRKVEKGVSTIKFYGTHDIFANYAPGDSTWLTNEYTVALKEGGDEVWIEAKPVVTVLGLFIRESMTPV